MRAADTCAVHHPIQPAESIHGCLRRAVARTGVGDIALHAENLAPGGDKVSGLRSSGGRVNIGDDHPCTLGRKERAGFGADAACPAGNENDSIYHCQN